MQADTSPPAFFVSEMSLSISAYCFLFMKNPFAATCGTFGVCGNTARCSKAIRANPAMRRFEFGRFNLKPSAAADGICIAAHSAWVFQGRGGQATASVKTGPATARVDEPARGCLRLCQRGDLVREIIYTNRKRSARPRFSNAKGRGFAADAVTPSSHPRSEA